jgi:hypothetical protein
MSTLAKAVRFDENSIWADLADGRIIAVPLACFPRLWHAPSKQRAQVEISQSVLHWEELDEDISIAGLLAGVGDLTRPVPIAA